MKKLILLLALTMLSFNSFANEDACLGLINRIIDVNLFRSSISTFNKDSLPSACAKTLDNAVNEIKINMKKTPQYSFNKSKKFFQLCDGYCIQPESSSRYYAVEQVFSFGPILKNDLFIYVPVNFLNGNIINVFFESRDSAHLFLQSF